MSKLKLKPYKSELYTPAQGLIEKVAGELAAIWFEAALSSGLKDDKYSKNPRRFAKKNLEKFIPHAVKHCFEILNNPNTPQDQKMMIYDELMRRVNDPEARSLFPSNTEADKPLNFNLPDDFIEKNLPHLLDKPKVH